MSMKRVLCITASLAVVTLSAFIGIYFGLVPNGPSRAFRLVEFEQFVATTDVFDDTGLVRYLFDFNTINVESTSGKLGPGSNCLFASFAAVPAETAHQVVRNVKKAGTLLSDETTRWSFSLMPRGTVALQFDTNPPKPISLLVFRTTFEYETWRVGRNSIKPIVTDTSGSYNYTASNTESSLEPIFALSTAGSNTSDSVMFNVTFVVASKRFDTSSVQLISQCNSTPCSLPLTIESGADAVVLEFMSNLNATAVDTTTSSANGTSIGVAIRLTGPISRYFIIAASVAGALLFAMLACTCAMRACNSRDRDERKRLLKD